MWNYYVNSYTRMWMSTKRCFRDLFSSLWWISWVRVQTGSPKSKGIASSKHSQRWMRFEVFFLVELDILSKKNTTQKDPKREILFCFAHGNGITFFDRNKQTSNKHTFVVLCFFFYWWQEPPFEKEMDQGRPVGGAWCGGRSCMSHGKGHEDPWNLSRECA